MSITVEGRLEQLERDVGKLLDRAEITEVLHRASRAVDRGDLEMMESCFHPDALDYRGVVNGSAANARKKLRSINLTVTQHVTTNISIDLDGDFADVESYVTAFHHIDPAPGCPERDELLRARYVDRFEKRAGAWKIACRITVWDWSGMWLSPKTWFQSMAEAGAETKFIYGRRDRQDAYYTRSIPDHLFDD